VEQNDSVNIQDMDGHSSLKKILMIKHRSTKKLNGLGRTQLALMQYISRRANILNNSQRKMLIENLTKLLSDLKGLVMLKKQINCL